jgi:2-hydroxychromene-2-carboxylate isomerase
VTAPPRVEFHFDFGSPNAYLAHLVVPEIERRTGVRFEYLPVLLGGVFKATGNVSPAVSLRGIKNKGEYAALETRRFLARHGIESYRWNPHFPVNTLQIMRGAVAAQRLGCFPRYRDEVYRHMWAEPKKLDDPEVIRAALLASGLPAEELLARAADPDVKQELIANTERSVARGVFGSPSFFVEGELFFGKDRLRELEDEIEAQKARGASALPVREPAGSRRAPTTAGG